MLGFRFDEVMSGTHQWESQPGAEFDMEFKITWGPNDVLKWFADRLVCLLHGTMTVGGLCENAPCKGTISLHYWKGIIKYDIHFIAHDTAYQYVGEKRNIKPWNLHRTHTTCYGTLIRVWDKKVVSKSVTHFRLSTLPSFLMSFRLV